MVPIILKTEHFTKSDVDINLMQLICVPTL